ncbi:MAG: 30S ribosomal protein S20 [Candidatus Brennerbacteria bacterium]|nr:30S ribosomal protein S20 [Candidatus Brennerbacteria bacterium]
MPRTRTAKKALRQNTRRRTRNLSRKAQARVAVKQYKQKLEDGDRAAARVALANAYQKLDKMAKVGFIKKNKARRLKSRLARKFPRG